MRHALALGMVWLAGVTSASAQVTDRLDLTAIVRSDRVSFEGNQKARLPVAGVGVSYRVWREMRVEGELTGATGQLRRAYEGDFMSYAGPDATREEILRMAVIARRTTVNTAGLGFATTVAVETREPGRVNLALRAGASYRHYTYTDDFDDLRVPEGFTIEKAEASMVDGRGSRGRGGLLIGASVPVRIVGRLHVAPEVRWVWGGPARVGNNYDEGTVGARAVWKF
ncbi:MAG TPA: hypothetical protein VFO48_09665 [Vicinamibacterales bacterium]|nr:hypothetical protein [Vicinamibacterales bacterium]